ncbi:hypothetical protein VC83_00535 [Pseudogymnoascus destructans]|uniref:Importin N-terminal domain-containing protein n=2 Tax=Pseudogymnoascus destructans TaxID=655981 RepID=L8GB47_PSED2|nr:uncharacterized protein VC83_00535 [Pseudogymnoascus destructans]ELR10445.1 hypothetical protein GMDG_00857 [Pseudogymnoascus destructans 20631-21]OAF62984.1 hypothetical protein VC83_00535 [Pseudogymnoascus destructans]
MEPPIPGSLKDVEELVTELYQPGDPKRIAHIQEALHTLQRSADGWQLANSLFQSSDEKVQFFGALTFTVKLNTDSASLSATDAEAVLNQLLTWLIVYLRRGSGPLALRKLCSTLVVYFLHFSASWALCVKHVILCLFADEAVGIERLQDAPETSQLVSRLSQEKLSAALWFSTTLAEEVEKVDGNNIKHHQFHDRMKQNAQDVVALIAPGLANVHEGANLPAKLRQDSMKCFQTWVLFSHRAYVDAGITLEPLKSLTKQAITCLPQEDMYEVTIELFADVLGNYSKFLSDEDFTLLFSLFNSSWSEQHYKQLIQGDYSFESLQYGHFIIALGDARIDELAKANDPASQQFLGALEGLLSAEGYVVAEDQIFVPALEFWSTFVEVMIDSLYSDENVTISILGPPASGATGSNETQHPKENSSEKKNEWFSTARVSVMRAIERCWRKIQYPPAEESFDDWPSSDKTGFNDARMEVIDFLQASYTLTGVSLFSMLADMVLRSLQNEAWYELEASLFCLGGLADCISEDETTDFILEKVISSALFTILADPTCSSPTRTRQATLALIGKYDEFFKTHTQYLPETLTFMFKSLSTTALAPTASKSIQSLCSSCRQALTSELGVFVHQYTDLTLAHSVDVIVKERIAGAIGAVIQALPEEHLKQEPLLGLLKTVEIDFQKSLQLRAAGFVDEAEARGIETLRCIGSIAKGLQAPTDIPLELSEGSPSDIDNFWVTGPGSATNSHLRTIIESLLAAFPQSGEILESVCNIFRAGFTERAPSPFILPSEAIVDFFTKLGPSTPRLVVIISTACSFVSVQGTKSTCKVNAELHRLCTWVLSLLQALNDPSNDPEIAQAGIDFLYRLLPSHVRILIEQPPTAQEFLFMFALKALRGRDPLPKFAAADFWSSFLSLANLDEDLQRSIDTALEHLGPMIADALVYNISGNAARSELDKVCDPLKKFVARHRSSKAWLENALSSNNFASDRVSDGEKRAFLQKIMNLRGARQSNQVVKNMWLECRGSNFAYTS